MPISIPLVLPGFLTVASTATRHEPGPLLLRSKNPLAAGCYSVFGSSAEPNSLSSPLGHLRAPPSFVLLLRR